MQEEKPEEPGAIADYSTTTIEELRVMYADQVVSRWGEGERDSAMARAREKSRGLLCNTIAVFDLDNIDKAMQAEARRCLTEEDRRILRRGG
jgi:hypothetical protein